MSCNRDGRKPEGGPDGAQSENLLKNHEKTAQQSGKIWYNTCRRFCVYCYANTSKEVVLKNKEKHSDNSESIID